MPGALVPRPSCCSQLACTAVDSRGRNHRRRCRIDDVVIKMVMMGSGLREFPSDPSLCAEDGEANTESECLPLATELLAACWGPVRYLLVHWHVLFVLERPGNDVGLVNFHLSDLVMGRVASRAAFVADGGLVPSFPDGLLKGAAGVG